MPNELEESAFAVLRNQLPGFYVPDREQKRHVRDQLNISHHLRSAFDALLLKVASFENITSSSDFVLVEIKVTRKYLPDLPKDPAGFFFGMTENEEMLLKVFGAKRCYVFVLLILSPKGTFWPIGTLSKV